MIKLYISEAKMGVILPSKIDAKIWAGGAELHNVTRREDARRGLVVLADAASARVVEAGRDKSGRYENGLPYLPAPEECEYTVGDCVIVGEPVARHGQTLWPDQRDWIEDHRGEVVGVVAVIQHLGGAGYNVRASDGTRQRLHTYQALPAPKERGAEEGGEQIALF